MEDTRRGFLGSSSVSMCREEKEEARMVFAAEASEREAFA